MKKFNENSKIGEIIADERAVEIIKNYLPNLLNNKMLGMAKMYTLKAAMNYASFVGLSNEQANTMAKEILEIEG